MKERIVQEIMPEVLEIPAETPENRIIRVIIAKENHQYGSDRSPGHHGRSRLRRKPDDALNAFRSDAACQIPSAGDVYLLSV